MSAADREDVGCPEPAASDTRTASARNCWARSVSSSGRMSLLAAFGTGLGQFGDAVSRGTCQERTRPSCTAWRGSAASRSQSAATLTRLPGMAARW